MAISVKRFIAWFAVCATAIWAAWGGIMASNAFESRWYQNSSQNEPVREARRLATVIGLLERRDSIVRALRANPMTNGLSVVITNAATPRERTLLESTIRKVWQRAVPGTAVRPTLILVTDSRLGRTPEERASREASFALTPKEADGRTCVIVIAAGAFSGTATTTRNTVPVALVARMLENMAGICALHSKYGDPGAGIQQWLASRRWSLAGSTESDADSATDMTVTRPGADKATGAQFRTPAGMLGHEVFVAKGRSWSVGFEHIACLAGRDDACEAVPFESVRWVYRLSYPLLPSGFVRSVGALRTQPWNWQLLAALEEQLGPAKFAAFWTNAKPPADAMVDATGRTMGSWISDRLREAHVPLVASPWPTALEWLAHLALIGVPIGMMVLTRRRRFLSQ